MRLEPVSFAADGDGLQTDVMRFMAIIAFCLIAVLALVRNADPVTESPLPLPAEHSAEKAHVPETPAPRAEMLPAPIPARRQAEPQLETQSPPETPAKIPNLESEPVPSPGLALRFASDQDFLRLIETGRVRIYAFRPEDPRGTALGLGRNLEFVNSDPPGRIYELEAGTIPPRVVASLGRATRTRKPGGYSWGVRMPIELEASIRSWIDRGVEGELIIDRYAEVRHVSR